jgi:LuxR family maltose regulon positive regulatory protein
VLVPRAALLERLEAADDLPLTVVVGSAGSGKTSLLAEWVRARPGGRTTWIAADRGDADPVRFWYGFVAAVGLVEPSFGETAADLITLDGAVGPDVVEAILVDDAALTDRIRVVVDDVHQLSPEVMAQLQHLIDRGLQHLRLVLAGRSDPDVGLHRLRLRGGLCEIREADLRFDGRETRALVDHLGVDTTRIDVDALHARTEGWPAAVQMAALAMAASDDPAARLRALVGSTQTIGGYLASEVLASQSPQLRRFLEDTCVVDVLDADLCAALTAGSGEASAVTLASVEAAHLLLARVDPAGTAFRYHQLFAEMLRNHLRVSDPERFRRQHLRAAEAMRARGDSPAVIAHYWAAGRSDLAAQYTRQRPVAGYIDSPQLEVETDVELRREDILAAPGDAVGYVLTLLFTGRPREAQVMVDRVAALVRPDELDVVDRAHLLGVALGAALLRGDSRLAVERLEEAIELVPPRPGQDELLDLMVVTGVRALVWEGRHERAEELSAMLALTDRPLLGADLDAALAFADLERGELDRAVSRASEALRVLDEHGAAASGTAIAAHAVLAGAHLDCGDHERAEPHLAAVRAEHQPSRVPSFVLAAITRARLMRLHARFDAAFAAVAEGRYALGDTGATTMGARLDVTEIMLHLAVGAPERAAALIERLPSGWERRRVEAWHAIETGRVELAAALAADLDADLDADRTGSVPGGIAGSASTPRRQLDVALLRARLALDGVGSAWVGDAGAALDTVLDLVETTGAVMLVAQAGTGVLQAAVERARRRPRTPVVERLLMTRPLQRPMSQATPDYSIDQLSAREIVVLRYLATSMSNQEIADALYLSVNTVKTHIKHILRKLTASSRADAVRRAHALHYL